MKLLFCGGAGEVGASCYLVQIDGKNVLLDCGIRFTSSKDALPDFRLIQESGGIDAIVISHAHTDHTGALPAISRQFPNALIYMTHMSKDLTRVLLYDSLKIMEREGEIPIYAENHVREMLNRTICFSPNFTFKPFNDSDISVTFYSAGHIAGAASIYITSSEGSLFYSGDFCGFRQNSIEGASIPKLRPDVAIFESTYGDRLHANRQIEEQRLIESIDEVIGSGGKVLVPAFALGRAQEVILILKKAINKGQLSPYPIYVDGMVKDICRVYKLNPNYLKSDLAKKIFKGIDIFYDDNVIPVESPEQRRNIIESKTPCVIIASSGMLTGGPSQMYALSLANDERSLIAITGYQDEESPGRELLKIIGKSEDRGDDRSLKLGDVEINVKCKVGKYELSAHADKMEIVNLANSLYPRRIFLVHGNPESIMSLGKEIQKDINALIYAPENGEEYTINVKKPRKQKTVVKYPNMGKEEPLTRENISQLWEFVMTNVGTSTALSVEDLIEIWGFEQTPSVVKQILNESIYFEPDRRRMFLYRAVEKSQVEKLMASKVMEVNEMLTLVDEFFPAETGLYKKGARFDEKIALLYFNFPEIARDKYRDKIKEFEKRTGWQVEINKNINTQALDEVIHNLFPESVIINKISYMPQSRKVKVITEGEPENASELSQAFKNITGLTLVINEEDKKDIEDDFLSRSNKSPMEQNQALRYIDEIFSQMPHRPYKKSVKLTKSGVKYIELSFISKAVGEQYSHIIKKMAVETGYPMTIGDSCNQIEIISIAKRLAAEKGLKLKKNPSIYLDKMLVQIVLTQDLDDNLQEEIKSRFWTLTGMTLEIN